MIRPVTKLDPKPSHFGIFRAYLALWPRQGGVAWHLALAKPDLAEA